MGTPRSIAVIGQGYVGLELSLELLRIGYKVSGIDSSREKVLSISSGILTLSHLPSDLILESLANGAYSISADFSRVSEAEVVVICLPTPCGLNGNPDLGPLISGLKSISNHLKAGTLIVNESTSYPGTLEEVVVKVIYQSRPDLSGTLFFGVAPERVSPGNGVPLREISRVVAGIDSVSHQKIVEFYSSFCSSIYAASNPKIAEMSKLLENSFRLVNISFINEFNLICNNLEIDTREVIEAASTKPYGFMRFDPSSGIGGHCIPVDPLYLQYSAKKAGIESETIALASRLNDHHAEKLFSIVERSLQTNSQHRILILGVAYKEGLGDTRESPANRFRELFISRGIKFGWVDPMVDVWGGATSSSALDDWTVALILTPQRDLPISQLKNRRIPIFDFTGSYKEDSYIVQV